jgi:hypothetical protein
LITSAKIIGAGISYFVENCKWGTRIEQANNKRTSRLITFNGKTQTLALWARDLGLPITTLWNRFNLGWSTERAFTDELH